MFDEDTFLTLLYVLCDDLVKTDLPPEPVRPGPPPSLTRSEVLTLALAARTGRWSSLRAFYRHADRHLRTAFPTLPGWSQFNRLCRGAGASVAAVSHALARRLTAPACAYEILDSTALPVRAAKRRGRSWFVGQAGLGKSMRIGWYYGFHVLAAVTPAGVITGWGFGAANSVDQDLATSFLALRAQPQEAYPQVGAALSGGTYLGDGGFEGRAYHGQWATQYGAQVISPPQATSRQAWSPEWRAWLTRHRQMVETALDKWHNSFGLTTGRDHTLSGVHLRLAACAALHNAQIWLNRQVGRADLAFADLIDW